MNDESREKDHTNSEQVSDLPTHLSYDYIKLGHYREIFVTGVHGGITPNGYIQMSVFSERHPIPKHTVHKLSPNGAVGKELKDHRITRDSIIRSVEATLFMDVNTAEKTIEWMKLHIDKYKEAMADNKKGEEK